MVQTYLCLPLTPISGSLLHPTQLGPEVIAESITQPHIRSVAVKETHRSPVTNIGLAIDEDFVVECDVYYILTEVRPIQGNIDKQVVPVARPEILITNPTLFISQAMG